MIGSDLIPRRHVPGHGPLDAEIVLIGEAPGAQENYTGIPFIGPAGKELSRYLRSAGLSREQIYITNLSKFWPDQSPQGKQLPPSREAIIRDEPELLMELDMIRPRIIGAVGAHAARWLLQHRFDQLFRSEHNRKIKLSRDHGVPHTVRADDPIGRIEDPKYLGFDVVVIPLTHPSAGLHASGQQIAIQWDFQQLGLLYRNRIPAHPPVNEHPEPIYIELTDALGGAEIIRDILAGRTEIAIDTEGDFLSPECLTFCVEPGEAFLILPTERECLAAIDAHINAYHSICTVIFHYAGHDIPVVEIDEKLRRLNALGVRVNKYRAVNDDGSLSIRCTMSEAYLLGGIHPKGLKPLSWRISGGEMDAYEDVVGPTEERRSHEYLERVFEELRCPTCFGVGKLTQLKKGWGGADPNCHVCLGSGSVEFGRSGKRLKKPKRCDCVEPVKVAAATEERCPDCNDGLVVPMPDREFIFDADKQDFRWKQPQSMGKWVKRRLEKSYALVAEPDLGDSELGEDSAVAEEEQSEYFKLRTDWRDLEDRNDKLYVEERLGPMPRTRLFDVPDRQRVINYACADADYTLRNSRKLPAMLAERNLTTIQRIDAAVIPMISRMEQVGMMIDREDCERFVQELDELMDGARNRLSDLVGSKTNPNSPKVADILFRQLGLPVIKLTKSKTRESIDDDTLGALKASLRKRPDAEDPFSETAIAIDVMNCVTDYREWLKYKSTYVLPMLQKADRNDRLHPTINYTTVATGRLSEEDPNLQNIPNPDNSPIYGKRLRNLFIARPGYKLISADYSQIEMVVGAHLTQDAGMLEVFRRGLDLHTYAASLMFGLAYDQAPKHIRTQVKPLNFGCFYGLSAMGLQAQFASLPSGAIEKSEAECQELIDRYYAAFPGVLEWKKRLWQNARATGYVETMFGRKRLVPGLRSDIDKVRAAAEREAGNQPIQGTAQDILKIGMAGVWENVLPLVWDDGLDIEPINQVHDELLFECQEDRVGEVLPLIESELKYAVKLSVPIKVGISVADRWGMLK